MLNILFCFSLSHRMKVKTALQFTLSLMSFGMMLYREIRFHLDSAHSVCKKLYVNRSGFYNADLDLFKLWDAAEFDERFPDRPFHQRFHCLQLTDLS